MQSDNTRSFKRTAAALLTPLMTLCVACAAQTPAGEEQGKPLPADQSFVATGQALVIGGSAEGAVVADLHNPQAEHCNQADLLAAADRFEEAFECGDELFEVKFNALDGVGANVGDHQRFTRVPRADKNGPGEWLRHTPPRATGPNAEACNTCHSQPADDGAGPAAVNVIRDPERRGDISSFINRNTPGLFGLGALQRLAEEMTEELQGQREAGRGPDCQRRKGHRVVRLSSKGVNFGSMRVHCDPTKDDTRQVTGVGTDLVVRPLQWKGTVATVRDFNRGAGHNELGMQAVELTGLDVDGDGDGVVNELSVGDMTAMAIYVAAQPRPVTKIELDDLGLLELSAAERASISAGAQLFSQIGCATCHKPALLLHDPMFSEPSRNPSFRDATFPSGLDPLAFGVTPDDPISMDLTSDLPDNVLEVNGQEVRLGNFEADENGAAVVRLYGDLKRHDLGSRLEENIDEEGTGAGVWLTQELWGVGSTAPYMHDGRSTTVTEAILEHEGEAKNTTRAFTRLSTSQQADVVAFLENLILFKPE